MGYDKLDKSTTASYKKNRKERAYRTLRTFAFVFLLNVTLFAAVVFVLNTSSKEAEAAETPVVVNDNSALVLVNNDEGILTVQLDNNLIDNYEWKYGISDNNKIREIRSFENTYVSEREKEAAAGGRWTVSFEPTETGTGDIEITFFYVKDRESNSLYTKTLNVRINDSFDFEIL